MDRKRIFIVEDDPIIASDLAAILGDIGYEVCGISHQPFDAKKKIESLLPDLILLDINLNSDIDGIELALLIKNLKIGIVFISAFTDKKTIDRVKDIQPLGYIIKPFNEKDVEVTLELALFSLHKNNASNTNEPETDFIFVKTKNNTSVKVNFDDILFIEAYDNYSFIYTINDKIIVSYTLKELESRIQSASLLRVHRSYVVNCNKVDAMHFNALVIGKNEIPIGKSYKEAVLKFFPSL